MAAFAYIWNLGEAAAWTAGGTDAKPRLEWDPADADSGDGVAAYWVRLYNDATGTEGDADQVYSSGEVAGNPGFHDANWGMKNLDQGGAGNNGPELWWTIKVKDNTGEWSAESSRTPFKVAWAQAIYGNNIGAASGALSFSASAVAGGTQSAFLFRSADDASATNSTAWVNSIGAAPFPNSASKPYLNVLVRIATYAFASGTTGVQPALPDFTVLYQPSGSAVPDNWSRTPSGAWALDDDNRRYGERSFRCVVASAAYHYIEPYRKAAADGTAVTPLTDYVFSAFVKTNAPLTTDHVVRLEVRALDPTAFAAGDIKHGLLTGDEYEDGPGATDDTSAYSERWQRIHLHYRTGEAETFVRPIALYTKADGSTPTNNGDMFWVDAWQWEEGTVVSQWGPGSMSPAMVFDSYGLQADGVGGAKISLRNAEGSTSLDDLVRIHSGTGSPEGVYTAPVGHLYLRSDGGASTTLYVKQSGTSNTGWVAK